MEGLSGFLLAGVALAGSPGPATLSLAAAGAAFGARRTAAYLVGIVVGMVGVMAITASGVIGLLLALPGVTPVVTLAAEGRDRKPPSFAGGLGLSLVNPKGYAAMAALFSGFVLLRERLALDAGVKIALLTVVIVAVNLLWLLSGALLTRFFRDPRTNRIINVAFAVLLLASVALAITAA